MLTEINNDRIIDQSLFPIYNLDTDLIPLVFAQSSFKDFIHLTETCKPMNLLGKSHLVQLIDLGQISIRSLLKNRTIEELVHYLGSSALQKLSLKYFFHVNDTEMELIVKRFPRLRLLELTNASITQKAFEEITKLTHLETLSLIGCHQITNLNNLSALKHLRILRINSCKLKNLPSLQTFSLLRKLEISCVQLIEIPDLINFDYLEEISIKSCHHLKILPVIGELAALTLVKLSTCKSIAWDITKEWSIKVCETNPKCKLIYTKK